MRRGVILTFMKASAPTVCLFHAVKICVPDLRLPARLNVNVLRRDKEKMLRQPFDIKAFLCPGLDYSHDPGTPTRGVLKAFLPLCGSGLFYRSALVSELTALRNKKSPPTSLEGFVPRKGFEPSHLAALLPESSASTNFATWAAALNVNDL